MIDDVARTARVDVVPAEVDARIILSLLIRERIPQFTAVHIEQHLVAEEGTADAERDHDVRVLLHISPQFLEPCNRCRRVDVPLCDVGRL